MNILSKDAQKMSNITMQNYHGDINISPNPPWYDYLKVLENPNKALQDRFQIVGEQITFDKINYINAMVEIE